MLLLAGVKVVSYISSGPKLNSFSINEKSDFSQVLVDKSDKLIK